MHVVSIFCVVYSLRSRENCSLIDLYYSICSTWFFSRIVLFMNRYALIFFRVDSFQSDYFDHYNYFPRKWLALYGYDCDYNYYTIHGDLLPYDFIQIGGSQV